MNSIAPVVFIVDDDVSIRQALRNLFRSVGLKVETFETAQQFLSAERPDAPGCLVLDVRLPGMSGLELQQKLAEMHVQIPIVLITGHGDIPMSVHAMKAGAVEFLTKPFRDQDLLDAVHQAIDLDRGGRRQRSNLGVLQDRYNELTSREQEVFSLVVGGWVNKQIGAELDITETTVKLHRGRVMHKMRADSLAELVRMAERLGIRHDNYPQS